MIIDGVRWEIGGPAFNVCWYLRRLGHTVRLAAPYGRRNYALLKEALAVGRLDGSGLVAVDTDTDSLLSVWRGDGHWSVYVRGVLPRQVGKSLSAKCRRTKQLIVAGSRHNVIRGAVIDLIESQDMEVLGFNPSYAVYDYRPRELAYMLKRARVTILNEEECKHVLKVQDLRRTEDLARYVGGMLIVTRGSRGARVYRQSLITEMGSLARKSVFPLGAGDAFFAGFLHMLLRRAAVKEAARFAAAIAALVVESPRVRVDVSVREVVRRLGRV